MAGLVARYGYEGQRESVDSKRNTFFAAGNTFLAAENTFFTQQWQAGTYQFCRPRRPLTVKWQRAGKHVYG